MLPPRNSLLLAGVLAGLVLTGCPGPKEIGAESDSDDEMCMDGDMKPAPDDCNTCTCNDGSWVCTEKACGDEAPAECEDGDMKEAEDGCNTCTCYQGSWACTLLDCAVTTTTIDPTGQSSTSTGDPYVCGNGVVEGGELCDDGNAIDDDECPNDCGADANATEGTGETGDDTPTICGDGLVVGLESCDDGNMQDGDGCSSTCELEGEGACPDKPKDPLQITGAVIEGDLLLVDVAYGGGCEAHEIDYCWDGLFAESDPVQTWIELWHESHDDPCDAFIQEQRMLDLTAMKGAWQMAYQQQSGSMFIHLSGWDGSLEYSF